jgi:hypothetical protein
MFSIILKCTSLEYFASAKLFLKHILELFFFGGKSELWDALIKRLRRRGYGKESSSVVISLEVSYLPFSCYTLL